MSIQLSDLAWFPTPFQRYYSLPNKIMQATHTHLPRFKHNQRDQLALWKQVRTCAIRERSVGGRWEMGIMNLVGPHLHDSPC